MSGYSIGQFKQIFFPDSRPNVVVRRYATKNVDDAVEYLREISPSVLGISLHFSSQGSIKAIAFATPTQVVWVSTEKLAPTSGLGTLLRDASVRLASFDMAQVALLIYKDLGFHVRGVDMSTLIAPSTRAPFSPSTFAQKMGLALPSHKLDVLWDSNEEQDICCSAFLTAKLAQVYDSTIEWTPKVKTEILEKKQLLCLADIVTERRQLKAAEPVRKQNDFATVQFTKDGVLLQNSRYKTRVRRGEKTMVEMEMEDGSTIHAKAVAMKGRQTTLHMSGFGAPGAVSKVVVRGREDLTCAEHAFNEFILLVLTGQASMDASEFICMLWFPELLNPNVSSSVQSRPDLSWANLNDSQRAAANAVLSPEVPFCLVHGPPGTGKTTVIAAAAKTWDSLGQPAWIVAQSNVAVKNIAEALVKRGVNFKLIVSKEFHFEWHEHIYERVDDVLIRSDDLGEDGYRMIGESAIILCTLSMLSNPVLQEKGIYDQVPAERLIIDEASQIGLSEYMHVFHQFRDDLVKVCFFGDPCQLPPYGQESVPSLKSVFQVKHLRKPLIQYLLDTQYRMPSPLGDFISKEMYNRKLRSQHEIKGPSCVRFVDVYKGEEEKSGTSWVNQEEARTIVHLVNNYYRLKDYAIITPYDAQRNIIEKMLNMETPKVYNVDSFQGNEADYIIVSVTRTAGAGFLYSRERVNVMLTRCRKGMIIVSSKSFLQDGAGRRTMIGHLASHWQDVYAQPNERTALAARQWIDWRLVVENRADLPGVPGSAVSRFPVVNPVFVPSPSTPGTPVSSRALDPFPLSFSTRTASATSPTWNQGSDDNRNGNSAGKSPSGSSSDSRLASVFVQQARQKWDSRIATPSTPDPQSGSAANQGSPTLHPSAEAFPALGSPNSLSSQPVGVWRRSQPAAKTLKPSQPGTSPRVLRIVPSSKPVGERSVRN